MLCIINISFLFVILKLWFEKNLQKHEIWIMI